MVLSPVGRAVLSDTNALLQYAFRSSSFHSAVSTPPAQPSQASLCPPSLWPHSSQDPHATWKCSSIPSVASCPQTQDLQPDGNDIYNHCLAVGRLSIPNLPLDSSSFRLAVYGPQAEDPQGDTGNSSLCLAIRRLGKTKLSLKLPRHSSSWLPGAGPGLPSHVLCWPQARCFSSPASPSVKYAVSYIHVRSLSSVPFAESHPLSQPRWAQMRSSAPGAPHRAFSSLHSSKFDPAQPSSARHTKGAGHTKGPSSAQLSGAHKGSLGRAPAQESKFQAKPPSRQTKGLAAELKACTSLGELKAAVQKNQQNLDGTSLLAAFQVAKNMGAHRAISQKQKVTWSLANVHGDRADMNFTTELYQEFIRMLPDCEPSSLATMVIAAPQLRFHNPALLTQLLPATQECLPDLKPFEVSSVMSAAASLSFQLTAVKPKDTGKRQAGSISPADARLALESAKSLVTAGMREAEGKLASRSSSILSNMLWICAKLDLRVSDAFVKELLESYRPSMKQANAVELVTMAWSLATLRRRGETNFLCELLDACRYDSLL
eukprot:gene23326-30569_t